MNSSDLQLFLETTGIAARIHRFESPVRTFAEASQVLRMDAVVLAKSILFQIGGQPLLVIASAGSRVSDKLLAALLGVSRSQIKLANPEAIKEITGFPVGGLPPFGFRSPIRTLMDETLQSPPLLFLGGGDEFSLLEIQPSVLLTASAAELVSLTQTRPEE